MSGFKTEMEATVRVPQEGFSLDDLKAHLRTSRIPLDCRLVPTTVRDLNVEGDLHEEQTPGYTETIGFIAKWAP